MACTHAAASSFFNGSFFTEVVFLSCAERIYTQTCFIPFWTLVEKRLREVTQLLITMGRKTKLSELKSRCPNSKCQNEKPSFLSL